MKVITRPSVFLIGATDIGVGYEEFLDHIGAGSWESDAETFADKAPEVAGRTCYNSFKNPRPGGNRAYMSHILEDAHGSVLEHAHFVVAICGVSRILTQEITRHRHHSPSQLSQRFVDESESAFVIPAIIELDDDVETSLDASDDGHLPMEYFPKAKWFDLFHIWAQMCGASLTNYRMLVAELEKAATDLDFKDKTTRRKRIREAARGVLVNDIESRLVLSGNARAWRWFLERRGTPDCALEMGRLTLALWRILAPAAPSIFQDGEVYHDNDGREWLRFAHHKV